MRSREGSRRLSRFTIVFGKGVSIRAVSGNCYPLPECGRSAFLPLADIAAEVTSAAVSSGGRFQQQLTCCLITARLIEDDCIRHIVRIRTPAVAHFPDETDRIPFRVDLVGLVGSAWAE